MDKANLLLLLLVLSSLAYYFGRKRSLAMVNGRVRDLHSLPNYYGFYVALWCGIPALLLLSVWFAAEDSVLSELILAGLPEPVQTQPVQTQPRVSQPVAEQPVQMQNGHIVYNRKYGDIPKGSYTGGSTYTVKHGDTLFYIAWVTGNDFRDLAQRNNVAAPYALNVGQVLQVGNASGQPITGNNPVAVASAQASGGNTGLVSKPAQKSTAVVASTPTITYSEDSGEQSANKMLPNNKPATTVTAPVTAPTASTTVPTASSTSTSSPISSWRWPTDGKIIENFSGTDGGNKGIDIAGSKGQAIVATADGRVVYAGNALRGYGNLIIIKHNDDYLSAYAHNDTMLVREQQEVKAGQKIATMGSTGTSSTRLHFEIRYKGKSVNPLQYLPQR